MSALIQADEEGNPDDSQQLAQDLIAVRDTLLLTPRFILNPSIFIIFDFFIRLDS